MNNPLINLFKKKTKTNTNLTNEIQNSNNNNNSINENNSTKEEQPKTETIENFLKIDKRNNFSEINKAEISKIKSLIDNFSQNEELINSNINIIMNKFLEKNSNSTFSKDTFIMSQNISKLVCKKNIIGKDNIYNVINYLTKSNKNKNITSLLLNKKKCEIIGSMLAYSFSRLHQYKIKDMNRLMEVRKTILEKGIDVQKDFAKYSKEGKNAEKKITYYWKTQRNKYICLPELIFLINIYSQVSEIEVDFNIFDENLNTDETQTQLIELTVLNIHWIFNSLKSFKFNLINEKFQELLYQYYNKKMNSLSVCCDENIKKNMFSNEDYIYKRKWNFQNFFEIEENRNITNLQYYNINIRKTVLLKKSLMDDVMKMGNIVDNTRNTISNLNVNNNFAKDFIIYKSINDDNKKKESMKYIIKAFHNILELILMTFFSLSISENCTNLEIVMNDSYTLEFLYFFENFAGFEVIDDNIRQFNILDLLIYNKINTLNKLNLEINSLDFTTFENILNIMYNNKSLSTINLSLFSSDVTYTPHFLWKICKFEQIDDINTIFEELFGESGSAFTDFEEKILNNLSTYFANNLSVFFDIIKNLENLNELCLNIEIPYNIMNKSYYINPLLKFILNILFYSLKDSKLQKLCLLSPNIMLDNRRISNINNLLSQINAEDNFLLKNLSLHFQFYQIPSITNFISTRIKILNIGDLDMYTFKIFCDKICEPLFMINSLLENLSIGLLNSIINFSIELKFLLRKLFNIKIRNLLSLSLYSNILIDNEIDYDYLLQILNNNWISEYNIILNYKSEMMMASFDEDVTNIKFFVPHNLEKKLLDPDDIMALRTNPLTFEVDNNKDYYDEAYWYLKYIFENVHVDKIKNEKRNKNMIMGILKYLYFLKTPKINHPLVQLGY